jgi:glycosyltransferase involved in cell wall biosynthesis
VKGIKLSIIVPVYKGERFLPQLLEEISEVVIQISAVRTELDVAECICVDDGSVDRSAEILESLVERYSWLRVVTLSRNFGQHPATVAGILNSSGDWIVTLDEDLQHRPQHIVAMLWQACSESADVVYARPLYGPHQSFLRDMTSSLAKACVARFTGNQFVTQFSSFRLIRGDVARAAAASCSHETYFDIAVTWFSNRFTTVAVEMIDRRYSENKESGYSPSRLIRHAMRLMVTSDARILRLGFHAGVCGMIFGMLLMIAIVTAKIRWPSAIPVQGWTSTIIVLLFVGGFLSIQVGVAMKFLSLILQRSQGKPTFFVVDRSNDRALRLALEALALKQRIHHSNEESLSNPSVNL